jgi:hypothetical protein
MPENIIVGNSDSIPSRKGYLVLGLVILLAMWAAFFAQRSAGDLMPSSLMNEFMAFYFLLFGVSKLFDIKGFAAEFARYDLIAQKSIGYAYAYPFLELAIAAGYFQNSYYINFLAAFVTLLGSTGILRQMIKRNELICVCLGTKVKMPLGVVSLIENLGMGAMASYMLVMMMGQSMTGMT